MQTGGELRIFYKFPPSHSHVIVLVDNINVEASHFHQNGRRRQRCRGIDIYEYLYYSHPTVKLDNFNTFLCV
jgi:hypothetical protein